MARYIVDGKVLDTSRAKKSFEEKICWNGSNYISKATNDQWIHEKLYKSARGKWYIVTTSQWQGSTPSASIITEEDAARWLLQNEYAVSDIPAELQKHVDALVE